jgi:hypothetical protein
LEIGERKVNMKFKMINAGSLQTQGLEGIIKN